MKSNRNIVTVVVAAIVALSLGGCGHDDSKSDYESLLRRERQSPSKLNTPDSGSQAELQTELPETDQPSLADEKQKHIWDLEHYTFELEWKFGKLIKKALQDQDQEALLECFCDGAGGNIPVPSSSRLNQGPGDSWWRLRESSVDATKPANAKETAQFLIDVAAEFIEIKKIGLRVLAIDRDQDVDNHYHLNLLLYAYGSDTEGPASLNSHHQVKVQFDDDEDIIAGKIILHWNINSVVRRGSDQRFFSEATEQYALDQCDLPDNWKCKPGTQPDTYTSQSVVDDFDRDGHLDLAISTLQGPQYFLRSVGGKSFQDVTKQVGLPTRRFQSLTTFATSIDYDNDGYPDLLLGKNLYHNEQGKRFRQVTSESGLKLNKASMGAVVVDFDADGLLDLYVLNHHGERGKARVGFVGDDESTGEANQLWRNAGGGTFKDVTQEAGVGASLRHSFAAAWLHANDDHYPDLYLVNDFGRNLFYINRGDGTFEEIGDSARVSDFANSMGVATGDLDNDGDTEIYVANMFSKMGRRIIAHISESDYSDEIVKGLHGACAGSHLYRRIGNEQRYDWTSTQRADLSAWIEGSPTAERVTGGLS